MNRPEAMAVAAFVAASGAGETFDVLVDRFPYTPVCSYRATDLGLIDRLADTLTVLLGLNAASVTLQWPDGEKVIVTNDKVGGLPPVIPGERVIETQTLSASETVRFVRRFVSLMESMSFAAGGGDKNIWVKFERSITDQAVVDFPFSDAFADVSEGAVLMALGGVDVEIGIRYAGLSVTLEVKANAGNLVNVGGIVEIDEL